MTERERLEESLGKWAEDQAMLTVQRNQLVTRALAAGVTKQEIHQRTGIARTTINRITEDAESASASAKR